MPLILNRADYSFQSPDLKILFWEFCARRHEELLPRRLLVNHVNQLLHAAHKYQSAINEKIPSAVPTQDLLASCNMFMEAGRLERNIEMTLLNDLSFPKRYVRCLQIYEVVNCMTNDFDLLLSKTKALISKENYVVKHLFLEFKQCYHHLLEGEKKRKICTSNFLEGFARRRFPLMAQP